jgi:hypothetical protein
MFQFPGLASTPLWIQGGMTGHHPCRVSPFGHRWITGCVLLPSAFRSLPRPSSPVRAKASTVRPFLLDRKSLPGPPSAEPHSLVTERTEPTTRTWCSQHPTSPSPKLSKYRQPMAACMLRFRLVVRMPGCSTCEGFLLRFRDRSRKASLLAAPERR